MLSPAQAVLKYPTPVLFQYLNDSVFLCCHDSSHGLCFSFLALILKPVCGTRCPERYINLQPCTEVWRSCCLKSLVFLSWLLMLKKRCCCCCCLKSLLLTMIVKISNVVVVVRNDYFGVHCTTFLPPTYPPPVRNKKILRCLVLSFLDHYFVHLTAYQQPGSIQVLSLLAFLSLGTRRSLYPT